MSVEAEEMVTIPKADLEALKAENRRLRREEGRRIALEIMKNDQGADSPGHVSFTREQLAERLGITE